MSKTTVFRATFRGCCHDCSSTPYGNPSFTVPLFLVITLGHGGRSCGDAAKRGRVRSLGYRSRRSPAGRRGVGTGLQTFLLEACSKKGYSDAYKHMDRRTDGRIETDRDRQIDRQTDRQRKTETQTETQTETETETNRQTNRDRQIDTLCVFVCVCVCLYTNCVHTTYKLFIRIYIYI